jgi:putative long chain acyl-CoA synthase
MEAIDPDAIVLPNWFERDPGRAADTAAILVTVRAGLRRRALISNRRWAFSALGAAAACTLKPNDTVYSCLPLHHPSGLFVAVGGALVGGSRLSLATRFDANTFWTEVRRYGATVVFYAGEMCRELVDAPPSPVERASPVRLFAGSGMRADVHKRVVDRFGAGVLEFFAATESSIVLANGSGRKVGSVGRPLPGSAEIALFAWDVSRGDLVRDGETKPKLAAAGEPGVLVARVDPKRSAIAIERDARARILRDVIDRGDSWLPTAELMRRDADGDHYLVDRLSDVIHTPHGTVFSRALEDALYDLPEIRLAAAYGVPTEQDEIAVAAIELSPGSELDRARLTAHFRAASPHERLRPDVVRVVEKLPMSDGFRPLKDALRVEGLGSAKRMFRWNPERREFV